MDAVYGSGSDGDDVVTFLRLLAPKNIERLEHSGGACAVYTHAASGFVRNGKLIRGVAAQ